MMSKENIDPVLKAALEAIVDAQSVKLTRIGRVNRLMDKLIVLDHELIQFILAVHPVEPELAEKMREWSVRHDLIREEIMESVDESIEAEQTLVTAYRNSLELLWKEFNG